MTATVAAPIPEGATKCSRRMLGFTPMETDASRLIDLAVHAEDAGYDAIAIPEAWGLDATVVLTEIARETSRIRLVAGILSIWGRTPGTLAMTAATLDERSAGRFVLGLGASTPVLAEGFHGVPFERPAVRLGETVASVRRLLRGQRAVAANGGDGLRLGVPQRPEIPIWVAGLGRRSTAVALHEADGWMPMMYPRRSLAESWCGERSTTRSVLVSGPITAVADDDPSKSHDAVRQLLGWYLTGMGRLYGDHVAACGFGVEVEALRIANPRPRPGVVVWPDAADPLLDELTVSGDAASVADGLARWDEVADVTVVQVGPGSARDLHAVVDAGAPEHP